MNSFEIENIDLQHFQIKVQEDAKRKFLAHFTNEPDCKRSSPIGFKSSFPFENPKRCALESAYGTTWQKGAVLHFCPAMKIRRRARLAEARKMCSLHLTTCA